MEEKSDSRKCTCPPQYHLACGCKCFRSEKSILGWYYDCSRCRIGHNRSNVDFDTKKRRAIEEVLRREKV